MHSNVRILILVLIAALAGCCHQPPVETKPGAYFGPTISFAELTRDVDAKAAKIPTLWARFTNFQGWFVDEKKQVTYVSGGGHLMYRSPNMLRLLVAHDIEGELLDVGSDGRNYWIWIKPNHQFILGDFSRASTGQNPGGIIGPEQILAILGVGPITPGPGDRSIPTMTFDIDDDAYDVVWYTPVRDQLLATKRIWYDRKTQLPRRVFLYDEKGRAVIEARLLGYAHVSVEGLPEGSGPQVANSFSVRFNDSGTQTTFELEEIALSHGDIPNSDTFQMPDLSELAAQGVKITHE